MLSSSSGRSSSGWSTSTGGATPRNPNAASSLGNSSTVGASNVPLDPLKYVNEMTSRASVNLDSLLQARKTVALYAEETNTQLKRNVYKNYQLFIDTSKEISYLKKEMSQLAKLLNEEHRLLDSLLALSVGGGGGGGGGSSKSGGGIGSSGSGSSHSGSSASAGGGSSSSSSNLRGGGGGLITDHGKPRSNRMDSREHQQQQTAADQSEDLEEEDEVPHWLTELPDDLDVYIAQRNFEEAVRLVADASNHFYAYYGPSKQSTSNGGGGQPVIADLRARIDAKTAELVDVLSAELNVAPDRSLQTGPRASRRAVALLVRLGKSALAIRLFLDQRSKLLKHRRAQKPTGGGSEGGGGGGADGNISGSTLPYMRRLTALYFSHIVETSKEFLRAFEIDLARLGSTASGNSSNSFNHSSGGGRRGSDEVSGVKNTSSTTTTTSTIGCTSGFAHSVLACLNTWTYQQLQAYLELLAKHVFIPAVSKETRAECVALALAHCAKLKTAIGVDLAFVVQRALQRPPYQLYQQ